MGGIGEACAFDHLPKLDIKNLVIGLGIKWSNRVTWLISSLQGVKT